MEVFTHSILPRSPVGKQISQYNRRDLYRIGKSVAVRPNCMVLARVKQLGILKYRGSRGGKVSIQREWDTNQGVHSYNLTDLPRSICTVVQHNRKSTTTFYQTAVSEVAQSYKCSTPTFYHPATLTLADGNSMPTSRILPDNKIKTNEFRSHRAGATTHKSHKIHKKQYGVNASNLVYPKRSNTLGNFTENVTCLTLNCHSVVRKDVLVGQLLRDENIDFALLTETWYSDEKQSQVETSDLNQNGYKLSVANRRNKTGGGIALTCKSSVKMRKIVSGTTESFEYGVWQMVFKSITINCVGIYRPPALATPSKFVKDFFEFVEDIISKYPNLMIMGDFNLHIHDDTNTISEFNNCLCAIGMKQHVHFPTHVLGQSLDLVITEDANGVELISCEPGPYLSDHRVVKVITKVKKENIISKTITYRNFNEINKTDFTSDLVDLKIESNSIDTYVDIFQDEMKHLVDKHAPLKEKTIICRNPKPWFNVNIRHSKQCVRKAERLWRRYLNPRDYDNFKIALNKYHHELKLEKQKTLSQKVLEYKGDSKKLYKFVSDLTGGKSDNPMPVVENESTLADQFADFFMGKIQKIRDSLTEFENYQPSTRHVAEFGKFRELNEDEIQKIMNQLQTKSCEIDVIPTKVLKSYSNELLPIITRLVNLSLTQGVFPVQWKQAIVRPLLKKAGLELTFSNYRPVSNLSFLSKLIEKAALYLLNKHVNEHNLLPKNQSAYRQHHSCESALLRLTNDILDAMEHQDVTAMIALDLSAAFDTVDHDILLDVLKSQYGVSGVALEWLNSYLRPRSCRVSVHKTMSSARDLTCSVPQGSCLGPWLYLTYAGTIFDIVPPSISVYGFADDHTAGIRFKPEPSIEAQSIDELEKFATEVNCWMNSNKLKMNSSKTEHIIFGSAPQLKKLHIHEIDICGDNIKRQTCIRYLGAYLDAMLTFKEHIKIKCRAAMLNFFRIKHIRKYLSQDATETLVLSLVISHLDYCNVLLYGISECDIAKLQRIQNMCAKLVLNLRKRDSSKQALYELHWLPIKARINFKILTYMFNCHVGNAPAYLIELLTPKHPQRSLRSSESSLDCYVVPANKRKTFSDRSFSHIGPKLWNSLPLEIKQCQSIESFKKQLKTHFFRDYFALF